MGLLKYRDVLGDKGDIDYVNNILRVSVSLLYFLFSKFECIMKA